MLNWGQSKIKSSSFATPLDLTLTPFLLTIFAQMLEYFDKVKLAIRIVDKRIFPKNLSPDRIQSHQASPPAILTQELLQNSLTPAQENLVESFLA